MCTEALIFDENKKWLIAALPKARLLRIARMLWIFVFKKLYFC